MRDLEEMCVRNNALLKVQADSCWLSSCLFYKMCIPVNVCLDIFDHEMTPYNKSRKGTG